MSEYGLFTDLVATVGCIVAAGGAITSAWVRGARWAPPDNDVPAGPAKVCSVLIAIVIAVLWYQDGKELMPEDLQDIAIYSALACFLLLISYMFLMVAYVYEKIVPITTTATRTERMIGGFWLKSYAKTLVANGETVQSILDGGAYNPDLVWPRASRALANICFIVVFIGLQFSGSIGIASSALLVNSPS